MPELNDIMEFDHVIEVKEDGSIVSRNDLYAPELYDDQLSDSKWELFSFAYTGQHGYNGPIMHNSEFIGGGLERDILATPGIYAAVVSDYSPTCMYCESLVTQLGGTWVDGYDDPECPTGPEGVHVGREDNTEGWAVVKLRETE